MIRSRALDKVNKLTKPSKPTKHEPPSRSRRARVDGSVDDAGCVIQFAQERQLQAYRIPIPLKQEKYYARQIPFDESPIRRSNEC